MNRSLPLALAAVALATGACQTRPTPASGYLSAYDGMAAPGFSLRAAVQQRRDDSASDAVPALYLQPAILANGAADALDDGERRVVLREVDRVLCHELSGRFAIVPAPGQDAATVRTVVSGIRPTGRTASAVSAVAGYFNPVPLIDVRVPRTTGGLSVESEMVGADGRQIAGVTWARDATVIGRESGSMSRVGDALQLTDAMGDAVGRAFATKARPRTERAATDPCAAYGPRRNIPRKIADIGFGALSGLYQPEVSGLARPAQDAPR